MPSVMSMLPSRLASPTWEQLEAGVPRKRKFSRAMESVIESAPSVSKSPRMKGVEPAAAFAVSIKSTRPSWSEAPRGVVGSVLLPVGASAFERLN